MSSSVSSPNPESSGPPLRALAMVLISLAIVFAAIGALSLTESDDTADTAAPATTSEVAKAPATTASRPPSSAVQAPVPTTASPSTSIDPASVEVRVLNNSGIAGLAAGTAATLTGEGWTIVETGNYSESQLDATTVYYGSAPGAEAAAEKIAQQLGSTAAASPAALSSFGEGVIVVVTQ